MISKCLHIDLGLVYVTNIIEEKKVLIISLPGLRDTPCGKADSYRPWHKMGCMMPVIKDCINCSLVLWNMLHAVVEEMTGLA